MGNGYFFDSLLHHISNHGDGTSLAQAYCATDCLGFYGGVPLGLEEVDAGRCGEIEAVQSVTLYVL